MHWISRLDLVPRIVPTSSVASSTMKLPWPAVMGDSLEQSDAEANGVLISVSETKVRAVQSGFTLYGQMVSSITTPPVESLLTAFSGPGAIPSSTQAIIADKASILSGPSPPPQ
jgi:hypothetical protein